MITIEQIKAMDGVIDDPDFGIIIKQGLNKIVIFPVWDGLYNLTIYFGSNLTPLERYTLVNPESNEAQAFFQRTLNMVSGV